VPSHGITRWQWHVELPTEEENMQSDWQISAIQGNTIRITKCDLSEVHEVNCSDLIYMPF